LTFLTAELKNPAGFGRIIRSGGKIEKIVEEKDATPSQRQIREINAGVYLFKFNDLFQALSKVSNQNKKGEFYLTDVIEIMINADRKVGSYKTAQSQEIIGINDRYELAKAVSVLRERKIKSLTEEGVTIYDPPSTWIDLEVKIGADTIVHPSVILEGKTQVGKQCQLYPFVHIVDSRVGNGVKILSSTMIERSTIRDEAQVGPFTHLLPKGEVEEGAGVGNFVEMKNTFFGKHSKAGHLTYLGDCRVGGKVNVGAGTITCNYDGRRKHKTLIDEGAFIGSGVELVAPVKIGKGAYVGAGSTISKDVSPESLAVERGKQIEKPGWAKKKRKK
jgi:bifunctional UDP-N-acetylglucosamine pyrophosphorylase/glucosamine-1-phosphate N-acetyltransferase